MKPVRALAPSTAPSMAPYMALVVALLMVLTACGYDPTVVPTPEPAAAATPGEPSTTPECGDATATYPASAQTNGPAVSRILQRKRLIVGVSADTYLLASRNPIAGKIEGFDIDMVNAVATALFGSKGPSKVTLRVISAADRIPVLQSGEVDLVVRNMTINCSRWEDIAFSNEYYRSGQKVLVRKDLADDGVDSPEELAGLRVCAPANTTSLDNIRTASPEAVLVPAANHTGCLVKLQQGEIDAITGDDTVLAGLAAQDPYAVVPPQQAFTEEPYGIGANSADVDLVRFLNSVLEQERADGGWQQSYQRWLGPLLNVPGEQPKPNYTRPLPSA
ncbi:glutamate ABC transporter substrate-binding protein [Nocardioides salsibiostraticola]